MRGESQGEGRERERDDFMKLYCYFSLTIFNG